MLSALQPLWDFLRRRTAESILAGVSDATAALAKGAEAQPSDAPEPVILLLDGPPKPAKRKAGA